MKSRLLESAFLEPPDAAASNWFLREKGDTGFSDRTINIHANPFRIGRLPQLDLWLPDGAVSKTHAELVLQGRKLVVRDLGSTNGTFINGQRVSPAAALRHGDLLQFASVAFRVDHCNVDPCLQTIQEGAAGWVNSIFQFDRLMSEPSIVPHFQPIVRFDDSSLIGYEALGRSNVEGLERPDAMFAAAACLDQQAALSCLLRWEGVRVGSQLPGAPSIFVNTHPTEIVTEDLRASLRGLRKQFPAQRLTLEIHEAAVTDIKSLTEFRAFLRDLQIDLAFDDFGAGQPRLIELTETSPDVVKFDIQFVRDIHRAPAKRQQMLATLVRLVRDLGIATLAEGVEVADEADVCRQIGFDLAQGYHFGRPSPLEKWAG